MRIGEYFRKRARLCVALHLQSSFVHALGAHTQLAITFRIAYYNNVLWLIHGHNMAPLDLNMKITVAFTFHAAFRMRPVQHCTLADRKSTTNHGQMQMQLCHCGLDGNEWTRAVCMHLCVWARVRAKAHDCQHIHSFWVASENIFVFVVAGKNNLHGPIQ